MDQSTTRNLLVRLVAGATGVLMIVLPLTVQGSLSVATRLAWTGAGLLSVYWSLPKTATELALRRRIFGDDRVDRLTDAIDAEAHDDGAVEGRRVS
ncbi:MAG TPA: hypothetical protein VF039_13800 [Longimicrobiales bacterium]